MSIDAVTQTTLIPGSVWTRPGKDGEEIAVTVLFVTNSTAPAAALKEHPQQVVFLTAKRNVQSMTLEAFVSKRKYSTTDKHIEALLEAITAEDLTDESDEIDIDSVPLPDDLRDLVNLGVENAASDTTFSAMVDAADKQSGHTFGVAPDHPMSEVLGAHFVSYSEGAERGDPQFIGNSSITLRFVLNQNLNLSMLRDVFGTSGSELEIDTFNIKSSLESTKVDFSVFVGAFLEVVSTGDGKSQTLGVIQLIADGDIRESQKLEVDTVAEQGPTETLIDLSSAPVQPEATATPGQAINVNVVTPTAVTTPA